MKSDEIIEAVEGVETAVLDDAKKASSWLKSAWEWAWNTSWKTKAVIGVIVLTGVLCGMWSAYRSTPTYVTRSEASVMLSSRASSLQSSIDAMARRMDEVETNLHQAQIELHAVEEKLSEKKAKNITTGSIKRRHR